MFKLSLPDPWRLIFQGLAALDSESPLYAQLSLLSEGGPKALSPAIVKTWHGDQSTGTFTADLTDGRQMTANFGFVGTHDGQDFVWADSNPSIETTLSAPSRSLRAALPLELAALSEDRTRITPRDVRVLTALAVEDFGADMGFTIQTNRTVVALVLTKLHVAPANAGNGTPASTPRPTVLARLFGKVQETVPVKTAHIPDPVADLCHLIQGFLHHGPRHLLPDARLREMEPQMRRAHSLLLSGDAARALQLFSDLTDQMGEHREDQEPTGWLYFCQGVAAAFLGDVARAEADFSVAARATQPPPATLLRMAKARIAQDPVPELKAAWMQSPTDFANFATAEEVANVVTALQAMNRDDSSPETVLRHAIAALCQIEKTASARSEAAAEHRTVAHQLCPQDTTAQTETNQEYLGLLMTWATPGRAPSLSVYSSHPERDPSQIVQINTETASNDMASFIVTFANSPIPYRYVLLRLSIFAQTPLWRLDQIIATTKENPFRVF